MTSTAGPRDGARRTSRWPLVVMFVSVGVTSLVLGYLTHEALATSLYARAFEQYAAADAAAAEASDDYAGALDRAHRATRQSDALEAVADPAYSGPDAVAALEDAADDLAAALEHAPGTELERQPRFAEPDHLATPAWERYADAPRLLESQGERLVEAERFEAASAPVTAAKRELLDAMDAVLVGAYEFAAGELVANPSATERARGDVQHLIDDAPDGTVLPAASAAAFTSLVQAVDALRASHAAEELRKLDPEYAVRSEIEAFARSISGGVALEFTWAYEVNGLSSDGWYSGTAQISSVDGGSGSITLSHSISDRWFDDPNARAVVVHEVGHTQIARSVCEALFTGGDFLGDHEMWATAWAIGKGYDLPGSGTEFYGRPTDIQIAVAAQCR